MGLQLDHLDFDTAANGETCPNPNLTIEIRCGSSRIVSRLTSQARHQCVCPENGHTSSFWEVQGTAPGALGLKNENTKEKSSNLLPEVSSVVNEGVTTLLNASLHLLKNAKQMNDSKTNDNKENTAPNLIAEDIPKKLDTSSSTQILSASPTDDVFLASIRADNDRDIRIIQQLSEARYKVDQALLMLKFNGKVDGTHNSFLMVTPQKPSASSSPRLSIAKKRSSTLNDPHQIDNHVDRKSIRTALALPPRGEKILKRRSVGSIYDHAQPVKRDVPTLRVTQPPGNAANKKKPAVKENITSNLRKSISMSQSMPKLPTSSKK